MADTQSFAGKVIVITGGARNIGRALALEMAAAGAAVCVTSRAARAELDAIVATITAQGGRAIRHVGDATDPANVRQLVDATGQAFGRIDMLVNGAVVHVVKPFLEITPEEWRKTLATVIDSAFYCTQACLPSMLANGGGAIVTLGGMQSLSGAAKRVNGSVAKHGLVGFTRGIAREFGDRNIRANCIAPGTMNTTRPAGRAARPEPTGIPLKRYGEADEIASVVRFLAGPGASGLTGHAIQVNGGQMMF